MITLAAAALYIGDHTLAYALPAVWKKVRGATEDRTFQHILNEAIDSVPCNLGIVDPAMSQDIKQQLERAVGDLTVGDVKRRFLEVQRFDFSTLVLDPERCLFQDIDSIREAYAAEVTRLVNAEVTTADSRLHHLVDIAWKRNNQIPVPLVLTPRVIAAAIEPITSSRIQTWTNENPTLITRNQELAEVAAFLFDPLQRWCVVPGIGRTGKTWFMASVADAALEEGWAVLAISGRNLGWDEQASTIEDELENASARVTWRRVLVRIWENIPEDIKGLLIVVDGVDIFEDLKEMRNAFESLADQFGLVPKSKVKMLFSSPNSVWRELERMTPFARSFSSDERRIKPRRIEVGDFFESDLISGVQKLGWSDLVSARYIDGKPNPSISATLDMLRKPVMFGVYAKLREDVGHAPQGDWTELIVGFASALVQRVSDVLKTEEVFVRQLATQIAELGFDSQATKFRVRHSLLDGSLPALQVLQRNPAISPYAAMIDAGLLLQEDTGDTETDPIVGFQIDELGSFFLSFALEERLQDLVPEEQELKLREWVGLAAAWPQVLDAMLLLIARLSDADDDLVKRVVGTLAGAQGLNQRALFSLAPTSSTGSLFALLAEGTSGEFWDLSKSLQAVPFSEENRARILDKLADPVAEVAMAAIELAVIHRIAEAMPKLVELRVGDLGYLAKDPTVTTGSMYRAPNERVRSSAGRAMARLGSAATPAIEERLKAQPSFEIERRLWEAVRETGYRSDGIAQLIVEASRRRIDDEQSLALLENVLRTATMLLIGTLESDFAIIFSGEDIVAKRAAAEWLAQFPDPKQGSLLLDIFDQTLIEPEGWTRLHLLAEVALAAVRSGNASSKEHVFGTIYQAIEHGDSLSLADSLFISRRLSVSDVVSHLIARLASEVTTGDLRTVSHLLEPRLAKLWRVDDIKEFQNAIIRHGEQGIDIPGALAAELSSTAKMVEAAGRFYDEDRRFAIGLIAASGADNAGELLGTLLVESYWYEDQFIAENLRILGDASAEDWLLQKLDAWKLDFASSRRIDTGPLYALSTCGNTKASEWLIEFLKGVPDQLIELDMPFTILVPMLVRGVLDERQLAALAADPSATVSGRIAAIAALGEFNPERHADLFAAALQESHGAAFARWAIWALGQTKDAKYADVIVQQASQWEDDGWLAGIIADAVAQLGATSHAQFVSGLLSARSNSSYSAPIAYSLAKLDQTLAAETIIGILDGNPYLFWEEDLVRALEICWSQSSVRERVEQFARGIDAVDFAGGSRQAAAFDVLAFQDPKRAIVIALEQRSTGRLSPSSRRHLGTRLVQLERANSNAFAPLVWELLRDRNADVSSSTADRLTFLSTDQVINMLKEINLNADEWSTACAAFAMSRLDGFSPELEEMKKHPSIFVRRAATQAIKHLGVRAELKKHRDEILTTKRIPLGTYRAIETHGDFETEQFLLKFGREYPEHDPICESLIELSSKRRQKELKEALANDLDLESN